MNRVGQIIGLKPDQIEVYERLHAAVWPEVLAMISACNIRNYSIFRHGELLFAYFEYTGNDYEADMAKMAADPEDTRVVDAYQTSAGATGDTRIWRVVGYDEGSIPRGLAMKTIS